MKDHSIQLSELAGNMLIEDILNKTKYHKIKWKKNIMYQPTHKKINNSNIIDSYFSIYQTKKIFLYKLKDDYPIFVFSDYDNLGNFLTVESSNLIEIFEYIKYK